MTEPGITKQEHHRAIEAAAALIPACIAGDVAAKERLARWCLSRIRRKVILMYGAGPDVDDLTQMAISRVFDCLDSYRGEAGFYTWVDRITVNVLRDYFRSRQSRNRWEVVDTSLCDAVGRATGPDQEVERNRLLTTLAEHLRQMNQERRMALVLSLAEGYSISELAMILGISVEAAKKRVQRGRTELLKRLRTNPDFMDKLNEVSP